MNDARSNLKKIKIEDLKVGMFIVNMGRSWVSHPFLRNQLKVTSEKQIQKMLKYGIKEVYIDPYRGLDVPSLELDFADSTGPAPEAPIESPPLEESCSSTTEEKSALAGALHPPTDRKGVPLEQVVEQINKPESVVFWEKNIGMVEESLSSQQNPPVTPSVEQTPFAQEIKLARVIQEEAQTIIHHFMHDARLGRSIESDRVKRVVNNMADSILRNRDALVSLTRMKRFNEYTYIHSLDVCIFCLSLARHLSLSREDMLEIGIGALLHDVGKMKISFDILKKSDTLSDKEWAEVKKHPIYSLEIMEQSKEIPQRSKQLAVQHHERYNGSGYPFGLKGDAIDLFGQIAGIVDFYDAITSDRYYQKALQPHEGIREIYERSKVEFDPFWVERFIQCIGIYPFGTLVLLDTEEIGIVCGINPESILRPKILIIYQNSKNPYGQPFLVDLTERPERSDGYKRTIILPLDAQKWNIHTEAYLSDIQRNLDSQ